MKIFIGDVFKTSGIPTHTFVKPQEYTKLLVSLREKGRGLVIEGPSGIGKTTSVHKAIEDCGIAQEMISLSARKPDDVQRISMLPASKDAGLIVIDDFHVLSPAIKKSLSDFMKTLADEERTDVKLVLIGINKAGDALIAFSPDLNNRIDTIKFESNSEERIDLMIDQGEQALNVKINIRDEIRASAMGSFHIAQLLCKEACILSDISDGDTDNEQVTSTSMETVRARVFEEQGRAFASKARDFAIGSKLRREGRAPYLHILMWLAQSEDWSLDIKAVIAHNPAMRNSITQVLEKGYLENLMHDSPSLQEVLHFDEGANVLSIEDPKFMFFIKHILWNKFARQVGFTQINFKKQYDFALSFAGEEREIAEQLFAYISEHELSVFYDQNEQARILAENVEDYLAPIYKSEAEFVIVLLSSSYPKKIWTKFESDQFKARFGENAVIPIWFSNADPSIFDESRRYGGITFDPYKDIPSQIQEIGDLLIEKLGSIRNAEASTDGE